MDGFHPHFLHQGAQFQVLGVGCQQGRQEGGISNGNEVAIAIKSWCHVFGGPLFERISRKKSTVDCP